MAMVLYYMFQTVCRNKFVVGNLLLCVYCVLVHYLIDNISNSFAFEGENLEKGSSNTNSKKCKYLLPFNMLFLKKSKISHQTLILESIWLFVFLRSYGFPVAHVCSLWLLNILFLVNVHSFADRTFWGKFESCSTWGKKYSQDRMHRSSSVECKVRRIDKWNVQNFCNFKIHRTKLSLVLPSFAVPLIEACKLNSI